MNSFETCRARKNGGIKNIYNNCASRWSLTHCNMMHGTYNSKYSCRDENATTFTLCISVAFAGSSVTFVHITPGKMRINCEQELKNTEMKRFVNKRQAIYVDAVYRYP